MRVIQVVASVSEEASGPSYSVVRLSDSLAQLGLNAQIASLDWTQLKAPVANLITFPLGRGPRRLGRSPKFRKWLRAQVETDADVIHNHGLWMMPNVYCGDACRNATRTQLIVSPRGCLSTWALTSNRLVKRGFWLTMQQGAVRRAACLHATAESEYDDIRRAGLRQPVCVIPNGIDVHPIAKSKPDRRKKLLFLARIHPVKGLDVLLRAWRAVQDRHLDWDLDVIGPDNDGYLASMRALAKTLGAERLVFRGPLYGAAKHQAYADASLYVLPTRSENFGVTIAEALAAGTPAIVTKAAPWSDLPERRAGWWIDEGVPALVGCLEEALATAPQSLSDMGASGREWMKAEFSWSEIARRFQAVYEWISHGGGTPSFVRLD